MAFGLTWFEQGTDSLPGTAYYSRALFYDSKYWLIGGQINGTPSRKVYYSTNLVDWSEAGTDALPYTLYNTAAVVCNGKMVVIAGYAASLGANTRKVLSSVDGATWSEEGSDAYPVAVFGHDAAVVGTTIYSTGGYTTGYTANGYKSTDGGANWSAIGSLPLAVITHCMMADSSGNLYSIGGQFTGGGSKTNACYKSTDSGASFSLVGTLPVGIGGMACFVDEDDNLYSVGGITNTTIIDDVAVSTNGGSTWNNVGTIPYNANGLTAVFNSDRAVVFGGYLTQKVVVSFSDVAGDAAITLDDATVSAAGSVVSTTVTGAAAITLDDATAAGTGRLQYVGGVVAVKNVYQGVIDLVELLTPTDVTAGNSAYRFVDQQAEEIAHDRGFVVNIRSQAVTGYMLTNSSRRLSNFSVTVYHAASASVLDDEVRVSEDREQLITALGNVSLHDTRYVGAVLTDSIVATTTMDGSRNYLTEIAFVVNHI